MVTNPIETLLVPTDFSECSLNAVEIAVIIAKTHQSKVILLEVVHKLPTIHNLDEDEVVQQQHDAVLRQKLSRITDLADKLRDLHQINITAMISMGRTQETIIETAKNIGSDLIVMGTHGVKGVKEFIIGSNVYGVIESAHCAVLSIPQTAKVRSFDHILFPVRNIPNSLDKTAFLKRFVEGSEAKLTLFGIGETGEEDQKQLKTKIVELEKSLNEFGIEYSLISEFTTKNFSDQVLHKADELDCDLIVITSKVETSLSDFFLGTFAQQIVNHSTIAVLHIK